jgi:hypothetical protein
MTTTIVQTRPGAEDIVAQGAHHAVAPFTIRRAYGTLRKAGAAYLEANHYMRASGGSGQLFVVESGDGQIAGACLIGATSSRNCERSIAGACLIGPAPSKDAERSIAGDSVLIRQIKRLHLLDSVPKEAMCESQLLRHAMQSVCNEYNRPVMFCSYADPAATDERTGVPLCGWCYLAAGFFFAGETRSRRSCVIDHRGRARSTRQGKITLSRTTLPKTGNTFHGEYITQDWQLKMLPPARVWLAVTTPDRYTRKQAKSAWRACWAALVPSRKLAAKVWIDHVAWQRKLAAGKVSLGEPKSQHLRELDRFQPAWWDGWEMTRTAAPVWVPYTWQHELLLEADIEGERTANRRYKPLCA